MCMSLSDTVVTSFANWSELYNKSYFIEIKENIGKINKAIIDTINRNIVRSTEINQWKKTSNVLDWYANYTDKNKAKFVQFDIENFYPSVKSESLYNSLQLGKEVTTVSDNEKSLLYQEKLYSLMKKNHS